MHLDVKHFKQLLFNAPQRSFYVDYLKEYWWIVGLFLCILFPIESVLDKNEIVLAKKICLNGSWIYISAFYCIKLICCSVFILFYCCLLESTENTSNLWITQIKLKTFNIRTFQFDLKFTSIVDHIVIENRIVHISLNIIHIETKTLSVFKINVYCFRKYKSSTSLFIQRWRW